MTTAVEKDELAAILAAVRRAQQQVASARLAIGVADRHRARVHLEVAQKAATAAEIDLQRLIGP